MDLAINGLLCTNIHIAASPPLHSCTNGIFLLRSTHFRFRYLESLEMPMSLITKYIKRQLCKTENSPKWRNLSFVRSLIEKKEVPSSTRINYSNDDDRISPLKMSIRGMSRLKSFGGTPSLQTMTFLEGI